MHIAQRVLVSACLVAVGQLVADDQAPVSVATGRNGQTAWEFVGKISQNGVDMTMTGYITAIAGLSESQLFSDQVVRSADTARFKFTATGKMTTRNVLSPLFVLSSVSPGTITFNSAAQYGSPATIATTNTTLQTVVNVISPGRGIFNASGDMVRATASNFTLDGVTYRFGESNRVMRVTMVGDGSLTDPAGPLSSFVVAGKVVVGDYLPQQ